MPIARRDMWHSAHPLHMHRSKVHYYLTKSIKVKLAPIDHIYLKVYNKRDNKKYLKHIMTLNCLQKDKDLET